MDIQCHRIISKFVRASHVIRCLEMAGYDNVKVLQNLSEADFDQIEEYVRQTCSLMPEDRRSAIVGEPFVAQPEAFRLPKGVRLGLLMAVDELKKQNRCEDRASQTDPVTITAPLQMQQPNTQMDTGLPHQALLPAAFPFPFPLVHSSSVTSPCAVTISNGRSRAPPPAHTTHTSAPKVAVATTSLQIKKEPETSGQPLLAMAAAAAGTEPTSSVNGAVITPACQGVPEDMIDMEKLRSRSNASVLRLSSKQFEGAELREGVDFDITIETLPCEEGLKKVAGIYLCHLCKAKRERSAPVRFSIAKNRYPVVSNIMSHLKMHFPLRLVSTGGSGGTPGGAVATSVQGILSPDHLTQAALFAAATLHQHHQAAQQAHKHQLPVASAPTSAQVPLPHTPSAVGGVVYPSMMSPAVAAGAMWPKEQDVTNGNGVHMHLTEDDDLDDMNGDDSENTDQNLVMAGLTQ